MRTLTLLLAAFSLAAPLAGNAQDTADTVTYRVDSDASWIRVMAWPDGPLKRFGHHHVVSHHDISGSVNVAADPLASSFELELSVHDFTVDDPAMRALEGEEFEGEVPQKDIDGTRKNMLSEDLLHGEQYSTIRLRSSSIDGSLEDASVAAIVVVKDVEQTVTFPATIKLDDASFVVSGELELTHDAFGLSPFTAMGGALSVRDLLVIKYEIAGTRDN